MKSLNNDLKKTLKVDMVNKMSQTHKKFGINNQ